MAGKDCNELCWPMKQLAEDFPKAWIWSLSYDSSAWKKSDRGNIDGYVVVETLVQEMVEHVHIDQQRHPIIFVCHCLGGLMAKQIVLFAHNQLGKNPKYVNFLESIKGFLYYSTPHDGSFLVNHMKYIPNMEKMEKVVASLEVINDDIGRLNASFEYIERENYPNKWNHFCIGEAHETAIPHTKF